MATRRRDSNQYISTPKTLISYLNVLLIVLFYLFIYVTELDIEKYLIIITK